jgi:hypothetical protein
MASRTPHGTADREEHHPLVARAKTSAAAVFALVFGLTSVYTGLSVIFAPLAVVFGLLGIVLGLLGMRSARRPGISGRGVALAGLLLGVVGLLLGVAVTAGLTTFLLDESNLDRVQRQLETLRGRLPTEIPSP